MVSAGGRKGNFKRRKPVPTLELIAEIKRLKMVIFRRNLLIFIMFLISLFALAIGHKLGSQVQIQEARIYTEIITENNLKAQEKEDGYIIELELSKIRADIYKRQIQRLLDANDGLKTIIKGDPKLRRLIQ